MLSTSSLKLLFGYVVSFGILSTSPVRSECVVLEVSGSLYHDDTDGRYYLDVNNVCNSRHQWIHVTGKKFLYYVLDGYDGWMIGTWSCHWGNFLISVKSTDGRPYDLSETWKEFAYDLSVWKNNTKLRVHCVDYITYNSDLTDCKAAPCQYGASCVVSDGQMKCICQRGFYGRFCEKAIDTNHCKSSPCVNGASCSDLVNDFQCKCAPGFSGRLCDFKTDRQDTSGGTDCNSLPCDDQCPGSEPIRCFFSQHAAMIFVALGTFVVLSVAVVRVAVMLRKRTVRRTGAYSKQEMTESENESQNWTGVTYKRLESLDSVTTLDRVGL